MPKHTKDMTRKEFLSHPARFHTDGMFVIWSHEHQAWRAPNKGGYTKNLDDAGVYTQNQAADIVLDVIPAGVEVAVPVKYAHMTRIWGHNTKEG